MHLKSTQYHVIKKYFHEVFGEGEICLFEVNSHFVKFFVSLGDFCLDNFQKFNVK